MTWILLLLALGTLVGVLLLLVLVDRGLRVLHHVNAVLEALDKEWRA